MKKCVIFRKHAIAKTLINQVVIDIEGYDKHEIKAIIFSNFCHLLSSVQMSQYVIDRLAFVRVTP
jgi:hypothetical protein